jgi:hypothetical protein
MKHLKTFEVFLLESIRAEEAHRDRDAIQTVLDGKRDLGFITLIGTTLNSPEEFWDLIKSGRLKTIEVPSNQHKAYIYYRPGAERKANELKDIAERYGGYLAWDATEEDSRRIGELLDYAKRDIDLYIKKNYR